VSAVGGALLVAGASELFSDDQSSHQAQGGDEGGFSMTDLF
jgi:hypothetical protein